MSHDDRGAPVWNTESAAASRGIKFGKGFQRRGADVIGHDVARKEFEQFVEARKETVAEVRRGQLEAKDKVRATALWRSCCATSRACPHRPHCLLDCFVAEEWV